MRTLIVLLLICLSAPALAGKPTPEECKKDPMKQGCDKK